MFVALKIDVLRGFKCGMAIASKTNAAYNLNTDAIINVRDFLLRVFAK